MKIIKKCKLLDLLAETNMLDIAVEEIFPVKGSDTIALIPHR